MHAGQTDRKGDTLNISGLPTLRESLIAHTIPIRCRNADLPILAVRVRKYIRNRQSHSRSARSRAAGSSRHNPSVATLSSTRSAGASAYRRWGRTRGSRQPLPAAR
jgi:hypothetical protein